MTNPSDVIIRRLDEQVDAYCRRTRFFNEPITMGRARMWVLQHRLNTRQRNSVLKLRVATNCPDWDVRLQIIGACADEVIADEKYGTANRIGSTSKTLEPILEWDARRCRTQNRWTRR